MIKKHKNSQNNNKKLLFIITATTIIIIGIFAYFYFKSDKTDLKIDTTSKTSSQAQTAQEDFSDGDDRIVAEPADKGEATITDAQGNIDNIPDESSWTTSSTGQITVYSPSKNKILENNSLISGASSLDEVYFRVIDDVSGVISEGRLSVVSGKFSGNISFSTAASQGRIDVYSALGDGMEISNVEIPVLFK